MLVWRRAVSARSLLLAAALAALIATAMLAGLAEYSRAVIVDGARSAVAAAPVPERALLVQGQGTPGAEAALRDAVPGWRVHSGGYSSGRQFAGPTETARKDANGAVYANVMFIEGMRDRAVLAAGQWAVAGADPPQAMLGQAAANALGVKAGDTIPILDRRTDTLGQIKIAGTFAAKDPGDGIWLLTPELAGGAGPSGTTYGPLVLDRSDFEKGWHTGGSAGWVAEPDLARVTLDDLLAVLNPTSFLVAGDADRSALLKAADDGQTRFVSRVGEPRIGYQPISKIKTWQDRRAELELSGVNAVLSFAFGVGALGGVILALLAVGFAVLAEARTRGKALSRLRTMGLAHRQGRGLLLVELAPVVSAAVAAGAAVGLFLPALVGPALNLTSFTDGFEAGVHLDPMVIGGALGLVLAGLATALAVEAGFNRRTRLGEVLRVGSE